MRRIFLAMLLALLVIELGFCTPSQAWQIPEGVKSTQNPNDKPLSPAEALKTIRVPDGFKVTLFAGDPDVAQPIAFCFDDRGRLWVAECYSYRHWDPQGKKGHDRVVIFEDKDNDGQFDERTVFAENLANLTGIEIGFGGVWICSAPNLYFIPDANRDDKPDGPPVSKIDGWVVGNVGHNIFNGLTWGPDGWLYGCHGIQDESKLGKPGTPQEDRVKMRCGVWRYHPVKETVEVVCHGTTNPWGLDFNEYGDGFFTNCVIGHLWQMIPGAHFKRMYGEDYNTHAYELIDQHADHLHWVGKNWGDSRKGTPEQSEAGGGHAHVGAIIYLADNWPAKYRSMIGTCNVHGRRLNFDKLERDGSGYVGRRGEDMFFVDDPWFRGVTVKYGPDGGVYISDWSDLGECHDNDGVHCESGRIYKVVYGEPNKLSKDLDIGAASMEELVAYQRHPNAWYARRARLELNRRAGPFADDEAAAHIRKTLFNPKDSIPMQLRALWTLAAVGGSDDDFVFDRCNHRSEYIRRWAIEEMMESRRESDSKIDIVSEREHAQLIALAKDDPSPLVRLAIASALQKMPLELRWPIAGGLVAHEEDAEDHNLPLMIWYGIQPAVAADKAQALRLATKCKIPKVRQFIAKRVAEGSN